MRPLCLPRSGLLAVAALLLLAASAPALGEGRIIRLATGERVPFARMIADLAQAELVLVGERHDDHAQHWAQAQVITALAGRGPVAVGMEAFAADKDPALADWRRGRFESWLAFLGAVDWFRHWGLNPALYRPLLDAVRRHRLPLAGINVPRDWITHIAREGLAALDDDQRRRIGPVAEAPAAYAEALRRSLGKHAGDRSAAGFIAAQTAWDAAMAGALLDLRDAHPEAVVVGLAGTGHIRGGHGIPHQLASRRPDLAVATVIPYDPDRGPPEAGEADYAWAVAPRRDGEPVRIGVELDGTGKKAGVRVAGVRAGFPGPRAGLQEGDRILAVDGAAVPGATELIYRIRKNRWGGCLRLTIRRDGAKHTLEVPLERPEQAGEAG